MDEETAAERLRVALDLADFAESMVRARLRRERPHATAAEIEAAIDEWLLNRSDAPDADAVGHASNHRFM